MNLKFKYRTFSLLILMIVSVVTHGQEMLGLVFSTYSGVSGAMMNPALLTGSKVFVDVNLIGAGNSISNNMIYFPSGEISVLKLFSSDTIDVNNGDYKYNRNYTYFDNQNKKYIYGDLKVMGPSVMLQAGKHSFALSTAFRSVNSGNNIPYEMPIFLYEGPEYEAFQGNTFHQKNYSFASMTWSELNLSYALDFYERYDSRLTFGATVKGLFGHEGIYVAMRDADYVVHDAHTIQFNNLDADFGYSLPLDYKTDDLNFSPFVRGYGVGLDLGFVYTKKSSTYNLGNERKICAKPYSDYIYKIGISLLDLGGITFKNNAELHSFDNVGIYWEKFDTVHYQGISKTVRTYSKAFYGDPDASYASDRIRIALPTVISMQFDYHVNKNFYVAAAWSQPIKYQLNQLYRPAQIAVIPRYENRFLGVSVPVSLYNYREPRVGLALRIYSFTIGTERLGALMGFSNFTGMDIYFAFKISLQKGICLSYLKGACYNSDW